MLALFRQNVIHHIEQRTYLDLHAIFFTNFAFQRVGQAFAEFNAAAGELPQPAFVFGQRTAAGQKQLFPLVDDDGAHANPNVIDSAFHLNLPISGILNEIMIPRDYKRYPIPARPARAEIMVVNSRFIADAAPAFSVEEARKFIAQVQAEFPDASHHVPAFLIGYGASVTAHCSDDGEPSGTAGRPMLAVLQGSGLGDVVVVVTRYFGGTKLGTGGLVRAYGDAVKAVLAELPRAEKIPTHTVMLACEYSYFERIRLLAQEHHGQVLDESFGADVTLTIQFAVWHLDAFQDALREMTRGSLQAEIIETNPETIMPLDAFPGPDESAKK